MKKLFFALIAFSVTAVAQIDPRVYGHWSSQKALFSEPDYMDVYLEFVVKTDSTADMATVCKFQDGKVLRAAVNVSVVVTENELQILESKSDTITVDEDVCTITTQPFNAAYKIVDDKTMSIANPLDGEQLLFSRK